MPETFVNKRLAAGALGTSLSMLYTAGSSAKILNGTLTLCNTGSSDRLVRIRFASRYLLYDATPRSHETLELTTPHVLHATEQIEGMQDAGTDVDYIISGVEVTGSP